MGCSRSGSRVSNSPAASAKAQRSGADGIGADQFVMESNGRDLKGCDRRVAEWKDM